MKKPASSLRPNTQSRVKKPAKRLLVVGAAMSVTYACGHVVFVMVLGHSVVEVVAHLSMAVFAIPTHAAFAAVWD